MSHAGTVDGAQVIGEAVSIDGGELVVLLVLLAVAVARQRHGTVWV